jgi:arylformamidase
VRRFDLTRPLHERVAPYPGDPPFALGVLSDDRRNGGARTSEMRCPLHIGTHVDAPCHVVVDGGDVSAIPLDILIGPAQHVRLSGDGPVSGEEIAERLDDSTKRLLISRGRSLSPDAARMLAARTVLVGTDAASVDPPDGLDAHRALLSANVVVVENLVLDGVPEGKGELVCLPLPVLGADGLPARVVFSI